MPQAIEYRERSVRPGNLLLLLGQLARATLANYLGDISFQTQPIELVFNSLNCLVLTEMSNQTSNMYFSREKIPKGRAGNT